MRGSSLILRKVPSLCADRDSWVNFSSEFGVGAAFIGPGGGAVGGHDGDLPVPRRWFG